MPEQGPTFQTIEALNNEVSSWSRSTRNQLVQELHRLNIRQTGQLIKRISYRLRKADFQVERISYRFLRYGVFVEKGVGRGYSIERVKATTLLVGGMSGKRRPKRWFNPVMDERIPDLADQVAKHSADINAKRLKIL